jgi:two-component system nitrate/nitrite response regulator NarL
MKGGDIVHLAAKPLLLLAAVLALAKRKARLTTTTHSANNTASSPARIIVADDHDLVRESTRSLLDSEPDLQIIDEAKDGQETIELCRIHRPDLVLMDVRMPKMNGLDATRTIKEELPTTKVLIMSAYDAPCLVSEAVRAGADGYVIKLSPMQEKLDAIRGVLRGESRYP